MDNFLKMNDGLQRRLPQRFHLRDYTSKELRDIFKAKVLFILIYYLFDNINYH